MSLSIGVGSFQDDDETSGIAHLTEHMLLLGSKQFPRPSEFEDHLSYHHGSTNTFTEDEKTTFYFEVNWEGFEKGLNMFAKMFADPLFPEEKVHSQLDKMYSEYKKNIDKDQWKEHNIIKKLANPVHPFSKNGNFAKLKKLEGSYLSKKLISFYNKYYTPNNMKLVVTCNIYIYPSKYEYRIVRGSHRYYFLRCKTR